MQLCSYCRSIAPEFFSPAFDHVEFREGPELHYPPVHDIRANAEAGCPLCTCLMPDADIGSMPFGVLYDAPVTMQRAIIGPHQVVRMNNCWGNLSNAYFARIPRDWCTLPKARLGEPYLDTHIMSHWLATCVKGHPKCSNAAAGAFVPTRLIDLRAFLDSKDIKLVVLPNQWSKVEYVALSHCWGPADKHPLSTRKCNLAQHSSRIIYSELSLTFKDAVRHTRGLGQRYLWIDSLCIVQDDAYDWEREAGKMASVYGKALYTLSALSSSDSTQGCRVVNPSSKHERRFFDLDIGADRVRVFEKGFTQWSKEDGDNIFRRWEFPLRGRAWTLQEKELSIRNIQFSQSQVLWECKTMRGSSEMPWQETHPTDKFQPWPVRNFPGEPNDTCMQRDWWYTLMMDYMSRGLTKSTDKLPALSGLAQDFQKKNPHSQYIAGLWSEHLPQALLWRVVPLKERSAHKTSLSYLAPSWSFLSLDASISYDSQSLRNRIEGVSADTMIDSYPPDLTVLGFEVVPAGIDNYGAIARACLTLRGKMVELFIDIHSPDSGVESESHALGPIDYQEYSLGRANQSSPCAVYFDSVVDNVDDSHIWCVSVRPEPYWTVVHNPFDREPSESKHADPAHATIMGLAVQRVDGVSSNTFRRVGLVRWLKQASFVDAQESAFLLV